LKHQIKPGKRRRNNRKFQETPLIPQQSLSLVRVLTLGFGSFSLGAGNEKPGAEFRPGWRTSLTYPFPSTAAYSGQII
jgi:hypothetical protein